VITVKHIKGIRDYLGPLRTLNRVGFIPTMGALHRGHIALIERAKAENSITVASIFVNPTQFNNKEDLARYPRTLEKDAIMLEKAGCNVLFAPEVEEMYPLRGQGAEVRDKWEDVDLGVLDKVMEGAHRPGHFKGVMQVVSKLFDIIEPHRAYFGQKDFQQLAVIKEMVRQLNYPVEIIACPTIREPDGLAMSSRNMRLTPDERKAAPKIAQVLFKVKEMAGTKSAEELKRFAEEELKKEKSFRLEYFEIADATTMLPAKTTKNAVACVALHLGSVRLIDNVLLDA
jgi:pantoate--beta-alanine ligase